MSTSDASIVVTLDIGGSAAKASAYDAARPASLGHAAAPYPRPAAGADPGLFDPQSWWRAALTALRDLREQLGEPAGRYLGITVSAIRIPFVLVDAGGEPVMPGLLNKDRRAQPYVGPAAAALGAERLYELTGHWPAPEFGLPKLLWARAAYPQAWRAARTILQLHDWFILRLSGTRASERSSAAMSQLVDVAAGTWAASLLDALDVPAGLLPGFIPAGGRAGGLLPVVARETGFAAGTPVHAGGGDTHMSALSAGAGAGIPVVVAGTTAPSVLAVPAARLAQIPARGLFPLLVSEHVVAGQRVLETNAGATGSVAALLAGLEPAAGDELARALAQRGFAVTAGAAGEPLTVLAGHPFFGPDGWAAAPPPTVIGLRGTDRGADVYQACLAGISLALRATVGCLLRQSGAAPEFIAVTGGMSTSPAWTQLLADVTGVPVRVRPLEAISGRAGAVLVTGEELPGCPADEEDTRVHEPDPATAPAHDAALARYQRLFRTAQSGPTSGGAGQRSGRRPDGERPDGQRPGGEVSRAGSR
jgi:xylulokinase